MRLQPRFDPVLWILVAVPLACGGSDSNPFMATLGLSADEGEASSTGSTDQGTGQTGDGDGTSGDGDGTTGDGDGTTGDGTTGDGDGTTTGDGDGTTTGDGTTGDGTTGDGDGTTGDGDGTTGGMPNCSTDEVISCGAFVHRDTNNGAANMNLYTGCTTAFAENAAELVFELTAPTTQEVTLTMTPSFGDDLDLWVLRDVCHEDACESYSKNSAGAVESVVFTAFGNVTYYVVVDGWSFHTGEFDLQVVCATPDRTMPS